MNELKGWPFEPLDDDPIPCGEGTCRTPANARLKAIFEGYGKSCCTTYVFMGKNEHDIENREQSKKKMNSLGALTEMGSDLCNNYSKSRSYYQDVIKFLHIPFLTALKQNQGLQPMIITQNL